MKQIATALVKAQKAFGPALKTATNPHFRSKYANLSNCVEAVIDALNDNGIFLLQKNYDSPNGIMVETVFVHESGEMLECGCLFFPAQKNDPQGFMSALTYGRRASLMAACGIAPEDDDGNAAARPTKTIVDSNAMADHIIAIQDSTDEASLKAAYQAAYKACGTDANWQKKVIAVKDEKKASLK
jgi:ERF superfamily